MQEKCPQWLNKRVSIFEKSFWKYTMNRDMKKETTNVSVQLKMFDVING